MNNKWSLVKTAIAATLIALTALATMVIRIPIPATTGYFNIGDVFVVLAGLWLGPVGGLLVGAIGPTIADAVGFPVYIPATMVTKALEGLLVGLIGFMARDNIKVKALAAAVGGITVVVGYFVFQSFIYPALGKSIPAFAISDMGAALVEIIPNAIQGLVGALGGLALWKALARVDLKAESARDL